MAAKIQFRQSDSVTTITSVTLISVTIALTIFLKTKSPSPSLDMFGYALMLIAILLFGFSAIKAYVDILTASYGNIKEAWNIKLFTYFGGLVVIVISIVYIILYKGT